MIDQIIDFILTFLFVIIFLFFAIASFLIILIIMSIKQTQKITQSIIHKLDLSLWQELVRKAVCKMPKFQLSQESNKVFHDFVLIEGSINQHFQRSITQQSQKNQPGRDNLQLGCIKGGANIRKYSHVSVIESEDPRKEDAHFRIKITTVANTDEHNKNSKKQSYLSSTCTKLFFKDIPNEEELDQQNLLRKTKMENVRYNQKLQELRREKLANSEQRSQTEKRKIRQMKAFTYDYEGKLISTNIKKNGNLKFVHLKSKFNQNLTKQHRKLLDKLHDSKYSQIVEKRIVSIDDNQSFNRESKLSKNVTPTFNNSINDLFKGANDIQMGVSITDIANNSKIGGNKQVLKNNSVKLSDFKRSFKSSSIMDKRYNGKVKTSSPQHQQKDYVRKKTVSDIQSKIISSSFSRYSKGIGKININNQKAFMESFYNDRL